MPSDAQGSPKSLFFRNYNPDEMLTNQKITSAWEMASPSTRDACATTAEEWIQQGPFLLSEITKALSTTRGSVSWKTLATLVSGSGNLEMMSNETIRKFVMALAWWIALQRPQLLCNGLWRGWKAGGG